MDFDLSPQARMVRARDFHAIAGFPKVIGAVDGTHVALRVVKSSAPVSYYNRKGFHSLNVMLICDAKLRILSVNASHAGGNHHSTVLYASAAYNELRTLPPGSGWLLADKFRNASNNAEERYNQAHVSTRQVVERAIGVLKSRFRCLDRSGGTLQYSHAVVGRIVLACCCLHNYALSQGSLFDASASVLQEEGVPVPGEEEHAEANPQDMEEPTAAASRIARANLVVRTFRQ